LVSALGTSRALQPNNLSLVDTIWPDADREFSLSFHASASPAAEKFLGGSCKFSSIAGQFWTEFFDFCAEFESTPVLFLVSPLGGLYCGLWEASSAARDGVSLHPFG